MLTRMGYAAMEAFSATEGLGAARAVRPDLVLLDFNLPDQDGLSLLAVQNEHRPRGAAGWRISPGAR